MARADWYHGPTTDAIYILNRRYPRPYVPPEVLRWDYYGPPKNKPYVLPEALKWKDAYGVSRTAREMTHEHLWNVMGFIRDRMLRRDGGLTRRKIERDSPFYFAAARELQRRGLLP